jgi:hydrogenase maturation protease
MKNLNDGAGDKHTGIVRIIGIGQSLRGDDAAGLHAARLWQETFQAVNPRSSVQVELAELPGIGLLSLMDGAEVVVLVDAVQSGAKPGTISIYSDNQLNAFIEGAGSAHGWGVAETLSLGRKVIPAAIPDKLVLIGIEVGQVTLGEKLSPEVEQAIPEAARLIEQCVTRDAPLD